MHRIDGGDTQAKTNGGVCRRAASLAQNTVGAAELDDLPHRQKITWIIERLDDFQLFLYLRNNVVGDLFSITRSRTVESLPAQPLGRRGPVGQLFRRITVTNLV